MRNWIRRPAALVVGMLVAAGLAAGVAWATIPDGSGTIHACYNSADKSMRVFDSGSCKKGKGEAPVSWNQGAIQGLPGPRGDKGPVGATGQQGPAGLTYAATVTGQAFADPQIGGFFKELTCPQGTKALDGTFQWVFFQDPMPPADVESFPIGDDAWGWAVGASSESKGLSMFLALTCVTAR